MSGMGLPVFVTGGNSGIGLALCKQLVADHGCRVFLGSRSLERGEAALQEIANKATGSVELVQCDTGDDASVQQASKCVKEKLGGEGKLFAIVNNAGTGLQHGIDMYCESL